MTISIHAPARGATPDEVQAAIDAGFQSTHPHGVRRGGALVAYGVLSGYFNPRTRTGCDFTTPARSIVSRDFNPRTRTGCDPPHAVYTVMGI